MNFYPKTGPEWTAAFGLTILQWLGGMTAGKQSFVENEEGRKGVSIFDEQWWFNAACPGAWDRREVRRDNQLLASLSFHTFKKFGMRYIQMPHLTRTLQPEVCPPGQKPVSRLKHQVSLLGELYKSLPRHDRFELCLPPETDLAFAFVQSGFQAKQTYTFRAAPHSSADPLAAMEQKTRNVIKTAAKRFYVEEHWDIERFMRLSRIERASSGQKDRFDYPAITRIFEASRLRNRAMIISAVTDQSIEVATAILVWDERVVYYWLSVRNAQLSGNGANSLLLWHAADFAQQRGAIFDLDGFLTPQNGMFLAKFGFKPVVRTFVTRSTPFWDGLFGLKSAFASGGSELRYR